MEDAAQAFGARANGRRLGAWADATCLSFNANKIVTSGGGGMVLSDSAQIVERARFLAGQAKAEGPEYVHREVGFNYRLPSAAALGTGQVARLEEFLERKRTNATDDADRLDEVPGIALPREAPWAESTFWLYTIHVQPTQFGCDVRVLHAHLEERGIDSRPIFTPLHVAACTPESKRSHARSPNDLGIPA